MLSFKNLSIFCHSSSSEDSVKGPTTGMQHKRLKIFQDITTNEEEKDVVLDELPFGYAREILTEFKT
jgi:hypothetical protein